jgi:DNA repair photolyase
VCYQINHDFEDIEIKANAPQILEAQLKRKRAKSMIATGAMSDPYIHLESDLKITRQCFEIIEKYGFGLAILTKSARILRDLDVLKAINNKARCVVQITLTTFDEDLCKIIEPNVSTTNERFQVLKTVQDAGIPTVVWLGPILPFINDTEENLRGLLDYCRIAKVHGILGFGFGVTMREGNRDYFYRCLDKQFPGMKERYIHQFGDSYVCNSPNSSRLNAIFQEFCKREGIIHKPKDVFAFLHKFETKQRQMSLFDKPII